MSFPLELSVILVLALFIYLFCAGVSSRVNPCDIKVVFSSEISVLQTPNTDTITRGGWVWGVHSIPKVGGKCCVSLSKNGALFFSSSGRDFAGERQETGVGAYHEKA